MVKLISGWTLLLVIIVFGARRMWPPEKPARQSPPTKASAVPIVTDEDRMLLGKAGPACAQTFERFLTAGTPEKRNQFVLSPVSTASRMARFYGLNPIPSIQPESLHMTASGLLHPPGATVFEAQWESSDGLLLDAAFREQEGEWRLDWDHFARYSDYPWALFLAGSGPDEGEFRLLARERLAEERKHEETISLVLYAPRFGKPREAGMQSPEFLVSRNSRDGQLLDAAFKLARSGGRVFSTRLPDVNPDGMIRIRVKVRRTEIDEERKFEITGVTACHWYSLDDPGVQPEPVNPETPAEPGSKPGK